MLVVGVGVRASGLGNRCVVCRRVVLVGDGLLDLVVSALVDNELRMAVGALLSVHEHKTVADGAALDVRFDANAAMRASGCLR